MNDEPQRSQRTQSFEDCLIFSGLGILGSPLRARRYTKERFVSDLQTLLKSLPRRTRRENRSPQRTQRSTEVFLANCLVRRTPGALSHIERPDAHLIVPWWGSCDSPQGTQKDAAGLWLAPAFPDLGEDWLNPTY